MERVQKQRGEITNQQRTAQGKFAVESKGDDFANGVNNSPAMAAQRKNLGSLFGNAIQRVDGEKSLQGKSAATQMKHELGEEEFLPGKFGAAQRVEKEESLQGRFETARREGMEKNRQSKVAQRVEAPAKPNNTGLSDNLKSGIESLSGMAMDNVKVHYNSSQPAQLNALAYAQGTDIHVAPGQEKHLPHEAWHVVQQAQGRVRPTMQMKDGMPVNDDAGLEQEADVMGAKAVSQHVSILAGVDRGNRKEASLGKFGVNSSAGRLVQRRPIAGNVYYGFAGARQPFINQDVNNGAQHLTVDTLNEAIGLSNATMNGPMGQKRAAVDIAAPVGGRQDLDADENAWSAWLGDRREPLLMPSMTGKQCRDDMSMDDSWWQRFTSWIGGPTRHRVRSRDEGWLLFNSWKQEKHSVNTDDENRAMIEWNEDQRDAHNDYVNADNANEGARYDRMEDLMPDPMLNEVHGRTMQWFAATVMHRFWRLTSLMGLDFFANMGRHVSFIREEGQQEHQNNGRKSITDSEWEHANNQGYVRDGTVERLDPQP